MTDTPVRKPFIEAFSGLGMGLLVGLILGLSITNVVATFAASLAALLGAYLGLSSKDVAIDSTGRSLRIGMFGFACAAGIIAGTALRAHDALGVPVQVRAQAWIDAGASRELAVRYVALEKLGIKPPDAVLIEKPVHLGTGLMSMATQEACTALASRRFNSISNRIASMENTSEEWKKLATSTVDIDDDRRAQIIEASYQLACGVKA